MYDKKNRVIRKIDSTNNSVSIENHYYEDFDEFTNENIIPIARISNPCPQNPIARIYNPCPHSKH